MAAGALQKIIQQDFSAGMFPSLAPELIPANGAYDITNGLLDEENVVYRRGGTTYFTATATGEPGFLWSGYLAKGGQQTLLGTASGMFRVSGGGLTPLGIAAPAGMARAQVFEGILYLPGGVTFDGEKAGSIAGEMPARFYASAGNRLIAANSAYPSRINVSTVPKLSEGKIKWEATNYLELPGGVEITGMQGLRTSVVIFTTEGIWILSGLTKELTDEKGNIQWTLDLYSAAEDLWGDAGIASYSGGLVVPCKDNVWIMEVGVSSEKSIPFLSISGPLTNVYRNYVAEGCRPGVAAVFRGHYFLPVLKGASVVDVLVCRLDAVSAKGRKTFPWTHLAGTGGLLAAFAVTDQEAQFLGATPGVGTVQALAYFAPGTSIAGVGASNDADGSAHPFSITTRDIQTGGLKPNLVAKARLSYRMVALGGDGIKMSVGETEAGGAEWGEFNWGEANWNSPTGPFTELAGEAESSAEGLTPHMWKVSKKVRYVRLRIQLVGAATNLSIRALEVFVRADGRTL